MKSIPEAHVELLNDILNWALDLPEKYLKEFDKLFIDRIKRAQESPAGVSQEKEKI